MLIRTKTLDLAKGILKVKVEDRQIQSQRKTLLLSAPLWPIRVEKTLMPRMFMQRDQWLKETEDLAAWYYKITFTAKKCKKIFLNGVSTISLILLLNYRFQPTDNKPLIPEKNILTGHKCDSKEELEDEDSDLLTEFALEPNEESFSEDIPLKLALETDYSWAAMDDTSKKVSELTHLAPTVYHANKV